MTLRPEGLQGLVHLMLSTSPASDTIMTAITSTEIAVVEKLLDDERPDEKITVLFPAAANLNPITLFLKRKVRIESDFRSFGPTKMIISVLDTYRDINFVQEDFQDFHQSHLQGSSHRTRCGIVDGP